eukprot:gene13083-15389_t
MKFLVAIVILSAVALSSATECKFNEYDFSPLAKDYMVYWAFCEPAIYRCGTTEVVPAACQVTHPEAKIYTLGDLKSMKFQVIPDGVDLIYNATGSAPCSNKMTRSTTRYLCGVHSKRDKRRVQLAKRSKASKEALKTEIYKLENEKIEEAAAANRAAGRQGKVVCSPLRMMKQPEYIEGYRKIFPNFKHGGRTDGLGMPTLSPMSLGPIVHGQPGVVDALNLENFHQGSKCFQKDLDADQSVGIKYAKSRDAMFTDAVPHRHKYKGDDGKPLLPLYFVWIDKAKKVHKLNALDCREFYCNFYERLASVQEDYKRLAALIANGTNLQIIGYDARTFNLTASGIQAEYRNTSRPFGHELVLASMLTLGQDTSQYPWRMSKKFDY